MCSWKALSFCVLTLMLLLIIGCSKGEKQSEVDQTDLEAESNLATIQLTSIKFKEGELIPSDYTCDGQDISPPLEWSEVPQNAKSLALICDDPDAPGGTWIHWVIYYIPPTTSELQEGMPTKETTSDGIRQGVNDFKKIGYGGPCPPGGTHRYYFKIYALDTELNLTSSAKKSDLEGAMKGHILAKGQLMGKYKRK